MSVCAHFLLLYYVQEVIIFMSNVLAAQLDSPTPSSIHCHHNRAGVTSLICIYVIYDTPEQMSGGVICIINALLLLTLRARHFPLSYEEVHIPEIGVNEWT